MKISLGLGKNARVFPAEAAAIKYCAEKMLRREAAIKTSAIFCGSQVAIKALRSYKVSYSLVGNCVSV